MPEMWDRWSPSGWDTDRFWLWLFLGGAAGCLVLAVLKWVSL